MLRVGVTGGYATGKSFVAKQLEVRGCKAIYADRLGHEVLLPGAEAYAPVLERFGKEILDRDDRIDRKRLGQLVFGNQEKLKALSEIVHPAVRKRELALVEQYHAADPQAIVLTEAAILIETGRYRDFDKLVITNCPRELQIERGMQRDHLTAQQVEERIRMQMPVEEKLQYADYIVDTGGPKQQTQRRIDEIFAELSALAANK